MDYSGFNLRMAKVLKARGVRVVYYISPQIWAWRKYRVRTIRKYVDLLLTILPFEKDWYSKQGVENIEYVGNPLVGKVAFQNNKDAFCTTHGLDRERTIVALLPGSRSTEIKHILPEMIKTARSMRKDHPNIQFVIAAAEGRAAVIREMVGDEKFCVVVENETYDALNAADAAAVASGTATLETGMIGTPMVIVYKGTEINNKILRPLISVEHFGLINLIAEERIATELIQNEFSSERLSDELFSLLEPARNAEIREKLKAATAKLGSGDASKLAAAAVIREIG
jgi:lipid-A-disaccharide synthase